MIYEVRDEPCTHCAREVVRVTSESDSELHVYMRHAEYPLIGLGIDSECDLPERHLASSCN